MILDKIFSGVNNIISTISKKDNVNTGENIIKGKLFLFTDSLGVYKQNQSEDGERFLMPIDDREIQGDYCIADITNEEALSSYIRVNDFKDMGNSTLELTEDEILEVVNLYTSMYGRDSMEEIAMHSAHSIMNPELKLYLLEIRFNQSRVFNSIVIYKSPTDNNTYELEYNINEIFWKNGRTVSKGNTTFMLSEEDGYEENKYYRSFLRKFIEIDETHCRYFNK